jgi:hypothetical protein
VPAPSPPVPAPVEPAAAAVEDRVEPQHADTVELTVRGAPPGAHVLLGEEVLGDASKPVPLPFGQAPLELTVSAPGYEPFALSVVPDHDGESEVKLKKRAPRPKAKRSVPSDLENPF